MTVYLLEADLPGSSAADLADLAARLRDAVLAASKEGARVRYVRSAFVPEDETCFHYVEAATRSQAELLARRADLSVDRILEVRDAVIPLMTDSKEGP